MHDIEALVRHRFSPKAFAERAVDEDTLRALFEAARWAPSCYNDQPWHFVVTRLGEAAHAALLASLSPGNQAWAGTAPLLVGAGFAVQRLDAIVTAPWDVRLDAVCSEAATYLAKESA